jgi:hypothetical protein
MPGLVADQRRLVEGHADLVSTYPNDPAAPDHAISLGHQLKPIWNIGLIGNFDCSPIDRDVPYPTACARSPDRNRCRFVDLGTRMPASLVHIPIGTPLASIKGKAAPCWHYQQKPARWLGIIERALVWSGVNAASCPERRACMLSSESPIATGRCVSERFLLWRFGQSSRAVSV